VLPTTLSLRVVPLDAKNSTELDSNFQLVSWKLGLAGFSFLESWRSSQIPWHSSDSKALFEITQKPRRLFLHGKLPKDPQNSEWEDFNAKCKEELDMHRLLQVRSSVACPCNDDCHIDSKPYDHGHKEVVWLLRYARLHQW
jgi:hypothetical protein